MNILYLHTHDSGRQLSPYGAAVPTDNLLKFSKQALTFTQAFCAGPTCSPSRAALLTGTYPHQNGMLGLAQRGFQLVNPSRHLAQLLGRNGYHTVLCGIQHESGWYLDANAPTTLGYDQVLTTQASNYAKEDLHHWDEDNATQVCQWLKEKRHNKPFFLSYGMHSTHRPYPIEIDPSIDENYVTSITPIASNAISRHDQAQYMTSAKAMDHCLGMVLDTLEELNELDSTIILFTTDHGVALPFHKCSLRDSGIGVSLIMRVPHSQHQGEVMDNLVSHVDIIPTLLDLLNIEKPDYLEGISFASLFFEGQVQPREEVFAEVNFHTSYEPMRCIRTQRYKYIRYYDESWLKYNLSNMDSSPVKEELIKQGLDQLSKPSEAFYDLLFDPQEQCNEINNEVYQTEITSLKEKLFQFQMKTHDPLLEGELPVYSHYKVNKKECIDASSKNPEDYDTRGHC